MTCSTLRHLNGECGLERQRRQKCNTDERCASLQSQKKRTTSINCCPHSSVIRIVEYFSKSKLREVTITVLFEDVSDLLLGELRDRRLWTVVIVWVQSESVAS